MINYDIFLDDSNNVINKIGINENDDHEINYNDNTIDNNDILWPFIFDWSNIMKWKTIVL